jgi:hypothetical protein
MSPADPSIKSVRPVWAGAKTQCQNTTCGRKWELEKKDMTLPGFFFYFATGVVEVPCQDCGALMHVNKEDYQKKR